MSYGYTEIQEQTLLFQLQYYGYLVINFNK